MISAHSHILNSDNVTFDTFFKASLKSVIVLSVYFDVENRKTYQEKLLLENKNKSISKILNSLISISEIK